MELWVLDESFNTVMIISQFNISWTKRWYDIGEFYLSIIDTYSETTAGILNPTKVRYIFRRDSNYIGRIDNIIYEDGLININGKFLENMLNFRTDYDYVNYRGTLEDVAFQIVNNNSIINKPIAYLVLGENKNKGSYINASIFGKKIGEYLYTLSDIYENSYNIKYDPLQHKIVFNVLWGLDRTQQQTINEWCLFGQQWGNVYSESYETNTDYANYAIVLGEGEGVSRKKLIIDLRKSDEELREILVDARDLQSNDLTNEEYEDKLRQRGLQQLAEQGLFENMLANVRISPNMPYSLGDVVSVRHTRTGFVFNMRITEEIESTDGNTIEKRISFGKRQGGVMTAIKNKAVT